MSRAIGFDQTTGSLVIVGRGIYPAKSLSAVVCPDGLTIQVQSLAQRNEFAEAWSAVTDLAGNSFPDLPTTLAYLQGEFSKSTLARAIPAPYSLNGAASFAISHGLAYVPTATILDPIGCEVDTDVSHAPGQTTLTFASPFTGTLYLG